MILIATLAACAVAIVSIFVPNNWQWPASEFGGLQIRYSDEITTVPDRVGSARAEYVYPALAGSLYEFDSPELSAELANVTRPDRQVSVRRFLFWQTGLASGFAPTGFDPGVQTLEPLMTTRDRIILALTIGPMVILECLLRSAFFSAPILLLLTTFWWIVRRRRSILRE